MAALPTSPTAASASAVAPAAATPVIPPTSSTGRNLGMHEAVGGPVTSMAVTPNGNYILLGFHNGIISLRGWNQFVGSHIMEVAAHRGSVTGILVMEGDEGKVAEGGAVGQTNVADPAKDPSSTSGGGGNFTVVSCSSDESIKCWSFPSGEWITTLSGHKGTVSNIDLFQGSSKKLVSAGTDGNISLWDLEKGTCLSTLRCHVGRVTSVLVPVKPPAPILDPNADPSAPLPAELEVPEIPADSIVFGGDSSAVFSGSDDTLVKLIYPAKKEVAAVYRPGAGVCSLQMVYPTLYVACSDGTLCGFDAETARPTAQFRGHTDSINRLMTIRYVKPTGAIAVHLLSLSDDRTIRWWNQETWKEALLLPGHTKSVLCGATDSNNQRFFTGGFDGAVMAWDASATLEAIQMAETAALEAAAALKAKKKKALEDKNAKQAPKKRR